MRLPQELHEKLVILAADEGRSLNNQIVWLLKIASDPDRLSDEQLLMKVQWILREIGTEVAKLEDRLPTPPDEDPSPKE